MVKEIIFYTDNTLKEEIAGKIQRNLKRISQEKNIPIICSSLKKMDFGNINLDFPNLERGAFTLLKQILGALENSRADVIFFTEHDVLYHPSHFDFIPPTDDAYYYNVNVWKVRFEDGHGLSVDNFRQLSCLCAYRIIVLNHFRKKVAIVEERRKAILASGSPLKNDGVSKYMGIEPGGQSKPRDVNELPIKSWRSEFPNIDIRHDSNFTKTKWNRDEYHDHRNTKGWTEQDNIPGWGHLWHFWKRVGRENEI